MQHAADSKHCRNCGAAYVYEAVYLGHLGRYRCPDCGRERPAPQVAAAAVALDGMRGSRVTLRTPAGEIELGLPLPGLYNVYNAVAAAATALELGVPLVAIRGALEGFGGRIRAGGDDSRRRARGLDPADQEPGGRKRGPAHPHARDGPPRPVAGPQRPDRRRPRHLVDMGCRLRGPGRPRAQRHLHRDPGRGDGPAAEVRGHRRHHRTSIATSPARSTAPCAARRANASMRFPPTRRCSSCATCSPAVDSPSGGRSERRRRLA